MKRSLEFSKNGLRQWTFPGREAVRYEQAGFMDHGKKDS